MGKEVGYINEPGMLGVLTRGDSYWLDEAFRLVGDPDVGLLTATEDEVIFTYNPDEFMVHQANELMSIAERDGRFSDYGVDVGKHIIFFKR